jgi:hypothetical protein
MARTRRRANNNWLLNWLLVAGRVVVSGERLMVVV